MRTKALLAQVTAVIDIGDYEEARRWLDEGRKFITGESPIDE